MILSLDLFFSVLILSVFLLIILNVQENYNFENNLLQNYAKNTLLYMDDSLLSQNTTLIILDINKYLPSYITYQLRVDYYNNNLLANTTILGDRLTNNYVSVTRPFIYGDNFGTASLRVWLGSRGSD
ncbi:Uncharacterised protein [Candidatus Tiddalikarchaeum anstoanum]|nr:Uncharacterised protein [Candidatus Tiddalikarchaeum anstoanum]